MSRNLKIAALVLLIVLIGGGAFGFYLFNKKQADLSSAAPDFVLNSDELQKAFETDEQGATARYTGKIIETAGEVISIIGSENGTLTVTLQTQSDLSKVICTFMSGKDSAEFELGKQATIRGECSGFLMDVLLNNCVSVTAK
jgi:hypothetical protein